MSPLSLSDIISRPRSWARQVGAGSTTVVSGKCRVFSAHFDEATGPTTPNPHGLLYNALSATGDAIKIFKAYGGYAGSSGARYVWHGPGLDFSTGLTIEVKGNGTVVVSYLEDL